MLDKFFDLFKKKEDKEVEETLETEETKEIEEDTAMIKEISEQTN